MDGILNGFGVFGVALLALVAWALWSTIKIVSQGTNYTVENLGRCTRTWQPAMQWRIKGKER